MTSAKLRIYTATCGTCPDWTNKIFTRYITIKLTNYTYVYSIDYLHSCFMKFNLIKGNENHTLSLSLCGGKKVCNDSYVCDDKMSYGRNVTVTSDYRTNMIKFHFTNGSQCADGNDSFLFYIIIYRLLFQMTIITRLLIYRFERPINFIYQV